MTRQTTGSGTLGIGRVALALLLVAGLGLPASAEEPVMHAHFIDVGQADATLLEFPCGAILIDAGAQDAEGVQALQDYLSNFFDGRPDLNRTLKTVIITHNHIDHTLALRDVVEHFTVEHYVDNGQLEGHGTQNPRWVRDNAHTGGRNIHLRTILDEEITELDPRNGLTDVHIDPVDCDACDPRIVILSGRLTTNPGWPHDEFDNKNNHSLVTRVDFDESSFLFTGDLEEHAIETLVDYYDGTARLDVDVYQVGHHGSNNATSVSLIEAMTPEIAVISAGKWDYGRGTNNRFTTWHYGHPRRVTVDLLTLAIQKRRSSPITVNVFDRPQGCRPYTVRKKIYATSWDGTVRIRADLAGAFRVTRNH